MNMAAVARLENPFRLSSFGDSGLVEKQGVLWKEKTNTKIMTDPEKSRTDTPVFVLVDEPLGKASEKDAP